MSQSIIIVGGGVIGLSLSWLLAREGCTVTLLERDRLGRKASWAAGGMLAPDAEIGFEERALYRLNRESLCRWPAFAEALEEETGQALGLRTEGTLTVADDRDAAESLRRLYLFQKNQGLEVEWLSSRDVRAVEPFLAPRLTGAIYSRNDYQVNNRALIEGLITALAGRKVTVREQTPVHKLISGKRPAVVTTEGERLEADHVVVAAGAWSRQLEGLDNELLPRVRPVRGQIIDLSMEPPFALRHVVRGPSAYIVPKSDGRLLIGATSEEMGFDESVTAGGIYSLLENAREVVPGIDDLPVECIDAGLRPGSRDNQPLLGPSGAPGITYATGHYRHGILLTPITAEEITCFVLEGTVSKWLEPFLPTRFVQSHP